MTRNSLEFPKPPWYMFRSGSGRRFRLSGDMFQQLLAALVGRGTKTATIGSTLSSGGTLVPQTRTESETGDQDPTG